MKINRFLSNKNKIATGLTAVLIGTTMIGSGIALSGYIPTKEATSVATMDETAKEKEDLTVEKVINKLGLPSFITKNKDINNDIILIKNEQNQSDDNIEFIRDNNLVYTSDKRICYDKVDRVLQLSTYSKGKHILNKYTLYEKSIFSTDKICKIKSKKTIYDLNGKSLNFDKINSTGITYNYNNSPLYIFDESVKYCGTYNAINKDFIYYDGNIYNFNGRYNYTSINYEKDKKKSFVSLRKEVSYLSDKVVKTYSKNEKEIKEFSDAFDNCKFDKLKTDLYNLYTKNEEATTTPKKK